MAANTGPSRTLALGTFVDGVLTYVATGTSQPIDARTPSKLAFYVQPNGSTISAGVLTVEEADWDPLAQAPYAGTWSSIMTLDLTTLSGLTQQMVYHLPADQAYAFVRARISTTITGGGKITCVVRGRA